MKAFDFDNTLYHGESAVDFALYMIRNNRKIILWLPVIFFNLIKYKLCLITGEKMETTVNSFMRSCLKDKSGLMDDVERFWRRNIRRLDRKMLSRIKKDDIIITAGPSFLFEPIKELLVTSRMICTEVDLDRKKVDYLNFSGNKVKRFRQLYGNRKVSCFFTDSYNDKAMMDISDKVYLVDKGRLKRIK